MQLYYLLNFTQLKQYSGCLIDAHKLIISKDKSKYHIVLFTLLFCDLVYLVFFKV